MCWSRGRHVLWNAFARLEVEIHDVQTCLISSPWAEIMEKVRPDLAEKYFETVRVPLGEVAVISVNERPFMIIRPGDTARFWKVLKEISVRRINVNETPKVDRTDIAAFESVAVADKLTGPAIVDVSVASHEAGLVFFDGELVEQIGAGRHGYWQIGRKVTSRVLDTRPLPLEVTAQEILTKDRVSVRFTLTAFTQVTDVRLAALSTPDYSSHIYKLVQFAVRESVGGRTLDEVLNDRESVDTQITDHVRRELGDIGVVVTELGIKDVILPGDMRELINRVVEAEKVAQANLIRRREETAATRSLLNTAKLMEQNPTLLRLKELEALEKVTEKVGRIDVHAGQGAGLNTLLDRLVSLKPAET